jgi:tetratricopeptide (TPR) repeat protein
MTRSIIEKVPDPEVNLPGDPQPLVLIPVTAEDFARRKWRIGMFAAVAILAALAVTGYLYKRYLDPLNARESYDAGTRLFKIARYNQAILSFDRAVALKPDLVDAYLLRGKSYVGNAEPDQALRDFSKVIELRPSDPIGWIERGFAYLELNNFQAAIADASQAISLNPHQASAYNLRGSAIRKNGDPRKALDDFNHAVELEPSADNYYQRGATYQLVGEHRLAIEDFTQVIDRIPDLGNAFFSRAQSRRAIGDIAGAKNDHRQGRILDGR